MGKECFDRRELQCLYGRAESVRFLVQEGSSVASSYDTAVYAFRSPNKNFVPASYSQRRILHQKQTHTQPASWHALSLAEAIWTQ